MSNNIDIGKLQINVTNIKNIPVKNASISISYSGEPEKTLMKIETDSQGQIENVELAAPPVELSLDANNIEQPYSEYTANVIAEGYEPLDISGIEILSTQNAIQNVRLVPEISTQTGNNIVIPAHTLYGEYPPKIAEAEIKPVNETGEIVLSRVVIPEYVVVHDGAPTDSTAKNYYVKYADYVKNVASSEIYSTWPENTLRANILAIMLFTLNRVYTEWYRNKGYDFTITSSTAFDHKWMSGRNIFESISLVVDDIFDRYLSRPNVKQPILTQYCDGKRVTCSNWMSQWGSKDLGEKGYSDIDIIQYYYGDNMYINSAEQISGIPSSWPGYNLEIGSSGEKVKQLQEQLNRISDDYSAINKIQADGIYGEKTAEAVKQFQKVFGLPQTGITDFRTWYKISQIYVGVSRIAELN